MGSGEETGFGCGEHLLVWSWRNMIRCREQWPAVLQQFEQIFGENGPEVFAAFCAFLRARGVSGRRRVHIGAPGCLAVTADERQMLTLIAAAQEEAPALLESHLRWMARPGQRHVLQAATGALVAALNANDLRLALPAMEPPATRERQFSVA